MVTIVMTYFDRQAQLNKTLESFRKYDPEKFNVIIVDDCSPKNITIERQPFDVTIMRITNKQWTNPEPAYNTGIVKALEDKADVIILQNAECCHAGDIIGYAERITEDKYIAFGCYSLAQGETPENVVMNQKCMTFDGDSAWYNHPVFRPVAFEFCSAITARNIIKLNGYDERFSNGYGYGDDYLLARIRMLGLQVEITENPFVFHQWHTNIFKNVNDKRSSLTPVGLQMHLKNQALYQQLIEEKDYRAKHLYTRDL